MATAVATPPPTGTATIPPTVADLLDQLGGIAPARVRLRPPFGTATESDLIEANARKLGLCELVDGTLVEKAMGLIESMLAVSIAALLRSFVLAHNLGFVIGSDGMIRLLGGNVRIPDVAYVSWDRTPDRRVPSTPRSEFAPNLAVEVLSPSNTPEEMSRKRAEYFASGVLLVWEVDPRARTVAVYIAPEQPIILDATMTLDGGAVLPGFALPLADLFAELDRQGA